jgi:hypothetical protein
MSESSTEREWTLNRRSTSSLRIGSANIRPEASTQEDVEPVPGRRGSDERPPRTLRPRRRRDCRDLRRLGRGEQRIERLCPADSSAPRRRAAVSFSVAVPRGNGEPLIGRDDEHRASPGPRQHHPGLISRFSRERAFMIPTRPPTRARRVLQRSCQSGGRNHRVEQAWRATPA